RLTRCGTKKKPFYRIVVTDRSAPRDGGVLEIVGTYDPAWNPAKVALKKERLSEWIKKGATPSDTVKSLLKKAGAFDEKQAA
ncbi:MAG: 30S ribosomal protein S16, partial [Deltaproteobacteria bacterium]|nr:30S ribosomal protein S16 [Deltaproteobacteria bacterium]